MLKVYDEYLGLLLIGIGILIVFNKIGLRLSGFEFLYWLLWVKK